MDSTRPNATPVLAVVGNPNTGKTTLFNALTGLSQRTGNFPGCTVEKKTGRILTENMAIDALDLPGTYSLAALSLDELVVPEVLLGIQAGADPVAAVLVVVDASSLPRNLYLVSQLAELGLPMVMALNMVDLAEERGLVINADLLSQRLGFPVIPTQGNSAGNLDDLRKTLTQAMSGDIKPAHSQLLQAQREEAVQLAQKLSTNDLVVPPQLVFRALLDETHHAREAIAEQSGPEALSKVMRKREALTEAHGNLIELEARTRYAWVGETLDGALAQPALEVQTRSDKVDRILTHKVWGLLILLVVLSVVFQTIYTWAGPVMDGIEGIVGSLGDMLGATMSDGMLKSLVVDGIIAGVGGVLVFLPQIIFLFLFIAVLEDCGYMARAAFLMDRIFAKAGLSGKSLIPMLSSFACAIPGIMATRTIENPRDRFTTIMVAPLMSCSARLPVYVIMIAAFIPAKTVFGIFGLQGLTLFAMYSLGVLVAVPTAWLLKRTLLKGETPPFLMELPDYKMPSFKTVGLRVFHSGSAFVQRAGTVILAVTIIVWALAYFPRPQSILTDYQNQTETETAQHQQNQKDLLVTYDAARFADTNPANLPDLIQNDPRLVNLGKGEAPQSSNPSLTILYSDWQTEQTRHSEAMDTLARDQSGALLRASYMGRMGQVVEPIVAPLGWDWRIGMATIASFPAREIIIATLGVIFNLGGDEDEASDLLKQTLIDAERSDGTKLFTIPVALSIMVFFALCAQCAATLATIRKETGSSKWAVISFSYMTGLAYIAAMLVYHVANLLGLGG